jgi:hypothetical protein
MSDGRSRLDAHLAAVDRALAGSGVGGDERRAVVMDLDAQIRVMLGDQSSEPSEAAIAAVLAQLDPPERFARAAASEPTPSRLGRFALLLALATLLGCVALGIAARLAGHPAEELLVFPYLLCEAAALVCGLLSVRTVPGRAAVAVAGSLIALVLAFAIVDALAARGAAAPAAAPAGP